MLVYVMSIPRPTATNVSELVNGSSGKKLNKTKMGSCTDRISALYSPKVGGLANGLSYKPWIEDGTQKIDELTKKPLTLQDKMERKWGLEPGFLTNKAWMNGDSLDEEKMTYYQKKYWSLNDGSTVFDTSNMDEELGYYMLLDSKLVANSEKEWRDHKWPDAKFYISLENEEDELKASKARSKAAAKALIVNPDFSLNMQQKFVHILGLAQTTVSLTPDAIFNVLDNYIDSTTFTPGSNIEKFNELAENLKTPHGRERIEARHLLKRALDSRIIFEKQGGYFWPRPEGQITLGENYSEAIEYLLDPKKEVMVEDMHAELKLKGF